MTLFAEYALGQLPRNLLLSSLPLSLQTTLLPKFQHVQLPLRKVLFEAGEPPEFVHFPLRGVASRVNVMENGDEMEVGITGCEGLVETNQLLGPQLGVTRCFVQVEGEALRMNLLQFRELLVTNGDLLWAFLRYVQHDSLVLAHLGACNRLHTVEQRLARWLLMVDDRTRTGKLVLTQEFLGEMLGARRSTVNIAAGSLQRAGVISYSRGRIAILDRLTLQSLACECYPTIGRLYRRLYK